MRKIIANGFAEIQFINELAERGRNTNKDVTNVVSEIIEDVRRNGDVAVKKYTEKFDKRIAETIEISKEKISSALENADEKFVNAMKNAISNLYEYHEKQRQHGYALTREDGTLLGQRVRGLHRVGLYVPGGTAAYPSSVIMNAIPAKIAEVGEIIMVTPQANADILVTAALCGIDKIYEIGGAQAVAALAYGTESIPKVDKIVGPGNIFVATAKKLLYGTVDIDMIAGPSEVLIIADESANPVYIAADLMSQAEHDALSSAVLITTSEKIADETIKEIERQIESLSRKEIIQQSLNMNGAAIVVKTADEAVKLANEIAPEHLEVAMHDPMTYLGKIDNAGSVFIGEFSPEPVGDYYSGTNHVLPTSGTARFFSPLSVSDFYKKSSYIYFSKAAFNAVRDDIVIIAQREGLTAHANSIIVREE